MENQPATTALTTGEAAERANFIRSQIPAGGLFRRAGMEDFADAVSAR